MKPVNPKGNQPWIFIGRTDAEAEAPILWPPDGTKWLIGKDPDSGQDWRQEEKGMTEDEMAGWHRRLNGYESEQAPGVGDGQGGLGCYSPWGPKGSDMTEWLNWAELTKIYQLKFVYISEFTHSVTALCLTLCNPMDCSPPDSSVYGVFQARILEWVAISFSRGSSQPSDQTRVYVSSLAGGFFTAEPPGKPRSYLTKGIHSLKENIVLLF